MVAASDELMAALRAVRSLGLRSWCIGAGAIRSLVWDTLHGFDQRSAVEDLDVVYFDVKASPEHDAGLENQLRSAMPGFTYESLGVVAPHGLDDLFELRVRHNLLRASVATYRQRVAAKRFGERWPRLSIEMG